MKILVVGPSWVGDMVMAQGLYKKIKADHPGSVIDVVAPEWSYPLISRMPEIRRPIALPVGHNRMKLSVRYRIGKELVQQKYDWAIITPRSWKSALIPFFANIPRRTGYRGEFRFGLINDSRRLDKNKLNQTILRLLALAQDKKLPLPPKIEYYPELAVDRNNQSRLIKEFGLTWEPPVVCFCPGAEYGPAKQWPAAYFRELAQMLIAEGYQVWTMGSAKEADLGCAIDPGYKSGYKNLCGMTRLEDTIDLMALASHAVSNDSGLMHVAAAAGIKLEAIYGSSSPAYTPPLSSRTNIHRIELECSPCFKSTCSYGHFKCLYEIYPEKIFKSMVSS
ncbi:MAG: lipopolysaccharide heptosyltransferase II [Desulfobacteraceae bacterium]|nr:lipopolysaccharide heptosyltransferase II [Desulfobacteraceae bacterium]